MTRRCSFPPPTLRERRHRFLARHRITVSRDAVFVVPEGQRPRPRRIHRRRCGFHDSADNDPIGKDIEVIATPLAGSDVPAGTMDEASPFRVLIPAVVFRQGRLCRLVRRILLIPSWEGQSADPEEKRGPCE